MSEIWLHANRRAFVAPTVVVAALAAGCAIGGARMGATTAIGATLVVAATVSAAVALGLALMSRRPRLAFDGSRVLFHVRFAPPVAVPVELVEAFLLGRGPTMLGNDRDTTETSTLVVKLAERAAEYERVETARLLAAWCGHYVTLRGTWTEPLGVELVNRLNLRLHEAQKAAKVRGGDSTSGPAKQSTTTAAESTT